MDSEISCGLSPSLFSFCGKFMELFVPISSCCFSISPSCFVISLSTGVPNVAGTVMSASASTFSTGDGMFRLLGGFGM